MVHDETSRNRHRQHGLLSFFALIFSFLVGSTSLAMQIAEDPGANKDEPVFNQYYTIDDSAADIQTDFSAPHKIFGDLIDDGAKAFAKSGVDLLRWIQHKGQIGSTPEKYNRLKHFGAWIKDPNDGTCYNTRAKVLIRDSATAVKFKDNNPCVVESGQWHEPYTGQIVTDAHDLDIDHVVPLKDVYVDAAYKWSDKKRCLYANYMANNFHLLSVNSSENRRKGDKSPAEYMPPNEDYACDYLQDWLKIKLIWDIPMQPPEKEAIAQLIQAHSCDPQIMKISKAEFKKQRNLTDELQSLCE